MLDQSDQHFWRNKEWVSRIMSGWREYDIPLAIVWCEDSQRYYQDWKRAIENVHIPLPRSNLMMKSASGEMDYILCQYLQLGPDKREVDVIQKWMPSANNYFMQLKNEDLVNILTLQWHGNQIYQLAMKLFKPEFSHEHVRFGGHAKVHTNKRGYPADPWFYHVKSIGKGNKNMEWMIFEPQIRKKLKDFQSTPEELSEIVVQKQYNTHKFWKNVVRQWLQSFTRIILSSPQVPGTVTVYRGEAVHENTVDLETYAHKQITGFTFDPATAIMYTRVHNHTGPRRLWRVKVNPNIPMFCGCGLAPPVIYYSFVECWVEPGAKLVVDERMTKTFMVEGHQVQIELVDAHFEL